MPWWGAGGAADSDSDSDSDSEATGQYWPLPATTRQARRRRSLRRAAAAAGFLVALTLATGAQFGFAERLTEVGVPQDQAGCSQTAVYRESELGSQSPLGPHSPDPEFHNISRVDYAQSPPVGGAYTYGYVPFRDKPFRGDDPPPVEVLVNGIRAGAIVVWYRPSEVTAQDLADLREIARRSSGKYLVVVPWEVERGPWNLPVDAKHSQDKIAISGWLHSTTCPTVSGQAIEEWWLAHAQGAPS